MKLTPNEVLGVTIKRMVCTEPATAYYSYLANLILEVADNRLLGIGTGTIRYGELADGVSLYPAVAWHHTQFVESHELDQLIAQTRIKHLIRTRSSGYDQSMVVLTNGIVIGNCDTGGRRILFVRSRFDEKLEAETQYWDYFSDQPVDHLGNNVAGNRVEPFRVGWV